MITKEEITRIVNREDTNVILMYGSWGIGKTFFWNEFENSFNSDTLSITYVSLFGLSNIDEVKNQIVINNSIVPANNFIENAVKFFSKVKVPLIEIDLKNIPGLLSQLQFSRVSNLLVCFDDVERKNESLKLREVLGLINFLVEKKNCKVMLILNQDQLKDKDLGLFRERIIDVEIEFNPDFSRNYHIIFPEKYPYDIVTYALLVQLRVFNIRILRKIKRNLDFFEDHFKDLELAVRHEIIKHIVLLTWSFYSSEETIPLDFITTYSQQIEYKLLSKQKKDWMADLDTKKKEEKEPSPILVDYAERLQRYGYYYVDYDYFLLEFIKKGNVAIESLTNVWKKLNDREKQSQVTEKLSEVWAIYNRNFQHNEDDFVTGVTNFMNENASKLSLSEYSSLRSFMKDIGKDITKYDEIVIKESTAGRSATEINDYLLSTAGIVGLNSDLVNRLKESIKDQLPRFSIKEILETSRKKHGWDTGAIAYLANTSEEEYYQWMIDSKDDTLVYDIREALNYANVSGDESQNFTMIVSKVKGALRKLASRSNFDRIRVEQLFGVSNNTQISDSPSPDLPE